jgi:aminocarboxymuconate-semialdehyde decarboxylase
LSKAQQKERPGDPDCEYHERKRRRNVIIDVHAHHYPRFYLDALRDPDSPFEFREDAASGDWAFFYRGGLAMGLPGRLRTIEERIAAMDANGVDVQVLSMAAPSVSFLGARRASELMREVNDSLLAVCRQSAGRFLAFAGVDTTDVGEAVSELRRVAPNPEIVGLAAFTHLAGTRLDDPSLGPLWEEVDRLALPVFVHPTVPLDEDIISRGSLSLLVGFPQETTKLIAAMHFARMFDRYPSINWIFCHLGGGIHAIWDRFTNAGKRAGLWQPPDLPFAEVARRIHYDCVSSHAPAMRLTYETAGPEQMLFGSDCPHVPIESPLRTLRSLGLPEVHQQMILSGNADRLLDVSGARPNA